MTDWQNRILRHGIKPAVEFTANPHNPRVHPKAQREAVKGSLDALGWIAPVIELANGDLLDGHERIWQALQQGDDTPVPYIVVDLNEDEAKLALLTFDFITAMATFDRELTAGLMQMVNTDNAALQSLIAGMAETNGIVMPDGGAWDNALSGLPDTDRAPFQQMTFTLHDTQAERVKEALQRAKSEGGIEGENENSNGNALFAICQAYLNG